jgi:hypothetical protein
MSMPIDSETVMTIRVPFHAQHAPLHLSPVALAAIAALAALLILLAPSAR